MIRCCKCKLDKDPSDFYNNKSSKTGKDKYCKLCRREYDNLKRPDYHKSYKRILTNDRILYMKVLRSSPVYRYYDKIRKLVARVCDYKNQPKNDNTVKLLDWTLEDLVNKLGSLEPNSHIDHKIPITWFTLDAPISIINHLDNLQYLDSHDNRSKSNRFSHPISLNYYDLILPYIKKEYYTKIQCV